MAGYKNLSSDVAVLSHLATTVAGTTTIDGTGVDMQGYQGVLIVCKFGTAAADNLLHAQQSQDNSSFADLTGTAVAPGASDELIFLDIFEPSDRYVRVQAQRTTSTTLDWGIAIAYGARKKPVDNTVAGTIAGEVHAGVAEGTK